MKESQSRLLRAVIAAMLLNAAPDGRAETYDLQRITASPDYGAEDDYDYFNAGYDNWDFNDYSEPSESGDEDPVEPDAPDPEKDAECDAIAAKVPSTCDLKNPPLLVTNGCGSGFSTNVIPDYLSVYGVPVLPLGPIFQDACNAHDVCYGTYYTVKEACDLTLNTNMINQAKLTLTDRQWTFYGAYIKMQAFAYSAGLQAPFIESISGDAFKAAQADGACRVYAAKANEAGCFD